jgi:hypothetical protein
VTHPDQETLALIQTGQLPVLLADTPTPPGASAPEVLT